jgi:peptidoglycan/LPS O-acetylase OafA/YrhL
VNVNPATAGRDNAFDLIRLILAGIVVYGHAHLVGGFGDEGFALVCRMQTTSGPFAVAGFFGISGFLVTRSFALRDNGLNFVRARLLRILPGFYFALLVTAFYLAPLIARFNPTAGPWAASSAFRYVWENALVRIRTPVVGGVLRGLPFDASINGALWTLFPELCCYCLVLVLGVLGWFRDGRTNVLLVAVAVLALHAAIVLGPKGYIVAPTFLQLTGWSPLIAAFLAGCLACCFQERLDIGGRSAVVWAAATLALLFFGGWSLLGPAVLALALIHTAYAFRVRLPCDLSYGTYLLHFPVLQLLTSLGGNRHGFAVFYAAGLAASAALAALSWYVVERPFLRLKA